MTKVPGSPEPPQTKGGGDRPAAGPRPPRPREGGTATLGISPAAPPAPAHPYLGSALGSGLAGNPHGLRHGPRPLQRCPGDSGAGAEGAGL